MKTRFLHLRPVVLAMLALSFLAAGQNFCSAQSSAPAPIKWDDYTFKFSAGGQMAQVFDADGKVVGSIIPMSGELQIMPLPGTDSAKLKKSFADWKVFNARSHAGSTSGAPAQTSDPTCVASAGAYYLADSAWKPMTLVDAQHGRGTSISGGLQDLAKNPFNSRAGQTNIITLTNSASHVVLGPHPKFCMGVPVTLSTDNIVIANLDVKSDHREIESLVSARNSAGTWIPQSRIHKVTVKRISDSAIEISALDELPPGQYVLAGSVTAATGTYDFGVQ